MRLLTSSPIDCRKPNGSPVPDRVLTVPVAANGARSGPTLAYSNVVELTTVTVSGIAVLNDSLEENTSIC